jgi:hypothetical protein
MTLSEGQIKNDLKEGLNRARYDAIIFTLLTLVLTPVFVIVAIIVIAFVFILVDLPLIDYFGYALSFVTGINLCLLFMVFHIFFVPSYPPRSLRVISTIFVRVLS